MLNFLLGGGGKHGGGWGHGHVMHYAIVLLISFLEIKAITSNSSCYMYQYVGMGIV